MHTQPYYATVKVVRRYTTQERYPWPLLVAWYPYLWCFNYVVRTAVSISSRCRKKKRNERADGCRSSSSLSPTPSYLKSIPEAVLLSTYTLASIYFFPNNHPICSTETSFASRPGFRCFETVFGLRARAWSLLSRVATRITSWWRQGCCFLSYNDIGPRSEQYLYTHDSLNHNICPSSFSLFFSILLQDTPPTLSSLTGIFIFFV